MAFLANFKSGGGFRDLQRTDIGSCLEYAIADGLAFLADFEPGGGFGVL
ncbi:MAG TPA: hypothetical protein V6C76_08460 [Drouetiella sp.]